MAEISRWRATILTWAMPTYEPVLDLSICPPAGRTWPHEPGRCCESCRLGVIFRRAVKIQLWNILFLLGFSAYVIIRGVFERRSNRDAAIAIASHHRDGFLILLMTVGGLILPMV